MTVNDIESALDDWMKSVQKISQMSINDQTKITKAGAEKYAELLKAETRSKHYSHHNDKIYGHAADNITLQANDIDGRKIGVSTVGWNNHYHAQNMMRLNDGTKTYQADHFKANLDDQESTISAVLEAEKAEYQKLVNRAEGES